MLKKKKKKPGIGSYDNCTVTEMNFSIKGNICPLELISWALIKLY